MKIYNKIMLTVGTVACLGMICSATQADQDTKSADHTVVEQVTGSVESQENPALTEQAPADDAVDEPAIPEETAETAEQDDTAQQAAQQQTVADMPDYPISLFSHNFHVNKMGFDCATCHPGIFQQVAGSAKAAGDFNMASFEKGKYCGACHDGAMAFSVQDKPSCARCHGSDMNPNPIVFEKPVKAVLFDHPKHTREFGLACTDCHESLFKMKIGSSEEQPDFNMEAIYKGKYCGACHDGTMAFAADTKCTKCHIGVKGYNRHFGKDKKQAEHDKGH